jgi:hypothetical protein
LHFTIAQHSRDTELMNSLIQYFGCGSVVKPSEKYSVEFAENKFTDIDGKILPFFEKYPLQGLKLLNFEDFCKVAEIMKAKGHLTEEGLVKIREIKAGMNRNRR